MEKSLLLISLALLFTVGDAFSAVLSVRNRAQSICTLKAWSDSTSNGCCNNEIGRRNFFLFPIQVALLGQATSLPAESAMENNQNIFKAGAPISEELAEERLREGRKSAQYLLDNYDEICEGGGDNVRRYLGTVGTSSGLYGISKVMKTLATRADDIVEYTETAQEVEKTIQQADGSAYMAIFVTTSTSYTPPAKYFGDAKVEIKRLIVALDQLAVLIDLKY
uniref:Uncharacterized protein n=1 Tax=Helicotheca tamesis TaxID=374047 RepID=A0A7S2MFK3_9STRA|mmetsp:Transcript_15372/g.21027  ORF Transcript_15372/g.21027 Transcript_15372/m.21027 type:complete len:222 (+) Transcript_15372:40-705(+)